MKTKKAIKRKEIISQQSVYVNKDVWFYPTAKGFDFVVWVDVAGNRVASQFRVPKKKLAKFI